MLAQFYPLSKCGRLLYQTHPKKEPKLALSGLI
jgi:hypothetical protein